MKLGFLILGTALAAPLSPALAQATNDDTASTENWWDKVGAAFFSDANLEVPRAEYEIRAQWTALSDDDQAAIRARCAEARGEGEGTAASLQEGDEDNAPDATTTDLADDAPPVAEGAVTDETDAELAAGEATTTTGSADAVEVQDPAQSGEVLPYTGLAGGIEADEVRTVRICDIVAKL